MPKDRFAGILRLFIKVSYLCYFFEIFLRSTASLVSPSRRPASTASELSPLLSSNAAVAALLSGVTPPLPTSSSSSRSHADLALDAARLAGSDAYGASSSRGGDAHAGSTSVSSHRDRGERDRDRDRYVVLFGIFFPPSVFLNVCLFIYFRPSFPQLHRFLLSYHSFLPSFLLSQLFLPS